MLVSTSLTFGRRYDSITWAILIISIYRLRLHMGFITPFSNASLWFIRRYMVSILEKQVFVS